MFLTIKIIATLQPFDDYFAKFYYFIKNIAAST